MNTIKDHDLTNAKNLFLSTAGTTSTNNVKTSLCQTDLGQTASLTLSLTLGPSLLPRPKGFFLLWFLVEDVAVVGANLVRVAKLAQNLLRLLSRVSKVGGRVTVTYILFNFVFLII